MKELIFLSRSSIALCAKEEHGLFREADSDWKMAAPDGAGPTPTTVQQKNKIKELKLK